MSSERLIIFETLIPAAGSNSFKVTTGPLLTFFILPFTPKSKRIFSRNSGSLFSFFTDWSLSFFVAIFKRSIEGSKNLFLLADLLFSALINGKSSWIKSFISSWGINSFIISFLFV